VHSDEADVSFQEVADTHEDEAQVRLGVLGVARHFVLDPREQVDSECLPSQVAHVCDCLGSHHVDPKSFETGAVAAERRARKPSRHPSPKE